MSRSSGGLPSSEFFRSYRLEDSGSQHPFGKSLLVPSTVLLNAPVASSSPEHRRTDNPCIPQKERSPRAVRSEQHRRARFVGWCECQSCNPPGNQCALKIVVRPISFFAALHASEEEVWFTPRRLEGVSKQRSVAMRTTRIRQHAQ